MAPKCPCWWRSRERGLLKVHLWLGQRKAHRRGAHCTGACRGRRSGQRPSYSQHSRGAAHPCERRCACHSPRTRCRFWHRRGAFRATRPCTGSSAAAACPGARRLCRRARRLGSAVCFPVAQQVAGLLEGLPALWVPAGTLLQGGPLQTPWPDGLCAGESPHSPSDIAGAAVSGLLSRVAPQGHCNFLSTTGPSGPAIHPGWVLLAQWFPVAGLATQGVKGHHQLQFPGHTVSIDEGEGFVEDLTFLAQRVPRHILPWGIPWTAVVALLGFLLISVAITLLSRQCTLDPLPSSRLPRGCSWFRHSQHFGLAMLHTCIRHGCL